MKAIVIKSDVGYALDLPVDVNPVISDILVALEEGIVFIEAVGELVNVVNGVPSIKNWEDLHGVKLGRKAMVYNTIYVKKLFVEEKKDRKDWSDNIASWLKKSRSRIATLLDAAPHLREFLIKEEQGWSKQSISIPCGNCGKFISGTRLTKKTQSKFIPDVPAIKGVGKNCRKWYCDCTNTVPDVPAHIEQEITLSVKEELEKLKLDYQLSITSVNTLENMYSDLFDKYELVQSDEGLSELLRKRFVDKFPGSMDAEDILAFARVIKYLKGE